MQFRLMEICSPVADRNDREFPRRYASARDFPTFAMAAFPIQTAVTMGKGGATMQSDASRQQKTIRVRCPDCLNYMTVKTQPNGSYSGTCPVCKAKIFSKEYSPKERHIKIVKRS